LKEIITFSRVYNVIVIKNATDIVHAYLLKSLETLMLCLGMRKDFHFEKFEDINKIVE
jgi:hypothetical protein